MASLSFGSSALLGSSLVAASLLLYSSPFLAPTTSVGAKKWPPPPTDQVSIVHSGAIQGQTPLDLYVVPSGRWLVVTQIDARLSGNALEVSESAGGVITRKSPPIDSFSTSQPYFQTAQQGLGLTFAPGSIVQVKIDANVEDVDTLRLRMIGYLTK